MLILILILILIFSIEIDTDIDIDIDIACRVLQFSLPHRHTMNGDIPPYQQAPPPYTTNSSFLPPTTNSHHYCDLPANGNAEYATVGNGHYSHVAVGNGMYESIPPRRPPIRNSSQDPDPIQPYAESNVGELKKSQGQSTHRIETANPLYATTDSLEQYSKATSDDDSLETGGDVDEKVSYYNT